MPSNVLVVCTDDHAQWAAGCYGNSELRTPTLDHLAATGVRMDNAFTPSPVCSPARASLWTGRLPSQHGVHDYLAESDPEVMATPWLESELTLARVFHDAGYVTGLSGKWHLGRPDVRPGGFDYWYSHGAPVRVPQGYESPWPKSTPAPGRYNPHAITDHAVEFLRNRQAEQPFFLFVGYLATHSPWSGHPERLVERYRRGTFADIPQDATHPFGRLRSEAMYTSRNDPREALAQYYASVSEVDEQLGRLVDELEAQGLRESTLVVYTSDHGLNAGHHGIWGKGNGTVPYNVVEESIRVPLIINHPGNVLSGQIRREPVTHCDTFLSIVEHAGLTPPAERDYPGRSHRDLWLGKAAGDWPDAVFAEYGDLRMIRTSRHKLVRRYPDGPDELFDLRADPRETVNRISCPEQRQLVEELTNRIEEYFGEHEDAERSGLRVRSLPRHNKDESWRDPGEHALTADPTWLALLDD
ncbi:sulfatase-like hydrolase/transferase [Saccharopolyspora sp. NPDC002686]|uniref:sulfatase-like hydrolase/transferase n=1 Tax=Saccharopolyspora sp. NPDC002686 TaxID=3154541 RepID=UPI0033343BF6